MKRRAPGNRAISKNAHQLLMPFSRNYEERQAKYNISFVYLAGNDEDNDCAKTYNIIIQFQFSIITKGRSFLGKQA